MTTLTISQKGWVVIPAELRKKYHLTPGSEVVIVDYGGVLAIIPTVQDAIRQGAGLLQDLKGLTGELVKERAHERRRDKSRRG
jgi:AbrB family looped-hinge helix DNA binding protein